MSKKNISYVKGGTDMADHKLIDEVGKYIDKYYEPVKDDIKMDKEKSTEKIDGAVATVMALDRAIRNEGSDGSVYDDRGILVF